MIRYSIWRILQLGFVIWGAVTLVFVLFFLLPSDPARIMAGGKTKNPDPIVVENIAAKYGLDQPIVTQYGNYMSSLVRLDFGDSFRGNKPVSEILAVRAPASMRLAVWALVFEAGAGIAIGFVASRWRSKKAESTLSVSTAVIAATPVFVFAYLLQQITGVYAKQHGWPSWAQLPVRGIGPNEWVAGLFPTYEQFRYLIQPVFVLGVVSVLVISKLTRAALAEVEDAPYLLTARSKGLSRARSLRKHGARNALSPVVTFIGLDFGLLVGSAVVTEQVFSWPGLGSDLVDATTARDLPVMVALTAVIVVTYGLVTLIADLIVAWMDPRVRDQLERS